MPDNLYISSCIVCNVTFSTAKGLEIINQQAKTKKHINNLSKFAKTQLQIVSQPQTSASSN